MGQVNKAQSHRQTKNKVLQLFPSKTSCNGLQAPFGPFLTPHNSRDRPLGCLASMLGLLGLLPVPLHAILSVDQRKPAFKHSNPSTFPFLGASHRRSPAPGSRFVLLGPRPAARRKANARGASDRYRAGSEPPRTPFSAHGNGDLQALTARTCKDPRPGGGLTRVSFINCLTLR